MLEKTLILEKMRIATRFFTQPNISTKNQLFELDVNKPSIYYTKPFSVLKTYGEAQGISFYTDDMLPRDKTNILLIIDLPRKRQELDDFLTKYSDYSIKKILVLMESPLGRPEFFVEANHRDFDLVLTYNPYLFNRNENYFCYFLPVAESRTVQNSIPFQERKPMVIINTNKHVGLFGWRNSSIYSLARGWKIKNSIKDCGAENLSLRRSLARTVENLFPECLEIYGGGWLPGETYSSLHHFFKPKGFQSARGNYSGDRHELIQKFRFKLDYENYRGSAGYISEKIFDTLAAGTVPIYMGDENISEHVWPECFVDARKFSSNRELLEFVINCSEQEWQAMYKAGQEYIASNDIRKFQSDEFAKTFLALV